MIAAGGPERKPCVAGSCGTEYFQRMESKAAKVLADPQIQLTLLGDAVFSAEVGFLVWDDDRHYVAANRRACELLGCTLEQLLGSVVGERTVEGEQAVARVIQGDGRRGRLTVERFDGRRITVEYLTFGTRSARLPYMASIIWAADDE